MKLGNACYTGLGKFETWIIRTTFQYMCFWYVNYNRSFEKNEIFPMGLFEYSIIWNKIFNYRSPKFRYPERWVIIYFFCLIKSNNSCSFIFSIVQLYSYSVIYISGFHYDCTHPAFISFNFSFYLFVIFTNLIFHVSYNFIIY